MTSVYLFCNAFVIFSKGLGYNLKGKLLALHPIIFLFLFFRFFSSCDTIAL